MKNDPEKIRDERTQAVLKHDYNQGPLLILAGPGTGKTYSLLKTIKAETEKGRRHLDFYEATLTNVTAADFIKDAKKEISEDFESSSTLHHRAKGILHEHAGLCGLHPGFSVIDDKEGEHFNIIKKDISHILGWQYRRFDNALKSYQKGLATCNARESIFTSLYERLQYFYSAINWFNIITLSCRLLKKHKSVREQECSRFRFLLIDEYQDLNPAEQEFVELLLDGRTYFLAVGDDDQSIYGWRYADPSGIVDFGKRYGNFQKITLPVTTRLPSKVITASYNLISRNKLREPKGVLIPLEETDNRGRDGFVVSVNLKSDKAEKLFIAQVLKELIERGISPERILVLCNCKPLGLELLESIEATGFNIPISNELKEDKYGEVEYLLLSYLKEFLREPEANFALRYVLGFLFQAYNGFSSTVVQFALDNRISLWASLNEIETDSLTDEVQRSKVVTIKRLLNRSLEIENLEDKLDFLISEISEFGFLRALVEKEIKEVAADRSTADIQERPTNRVRFLSMHKSKGLAGDFVFLPFMEASIGLPGDDIEEQRRLLYVAITRAKVGVIFSWAWSRRSGNRFKCSGDGGNFKDREPSPFILECGVNPTLRSVGAPESAPEVASKGICKYAEYCREYDKNIINDF